MKERATKVDIYVPCDDCKGTTWRRIGTAEKKCTCVNGYRPKRVSLSEFQHRLDKATRYADDDGTNYDED